MVIVYIKLKIVFIFEDREMNMVEEVCVQVIIVFVVVDYVLDKNVLKLYVII